MANIFLLTTIVIVVSSFVNCDRTAFLRNVNSLKQPVPLHLRHDQEESKRNMVKDQGQPRRDLRMGLLEPLLSWPLGTNHQNKEQTEERIRQLQNKLTPSKNIIPIRTLNQPLQKPDNEVKLYENKRHKREAIGLDNNNRQKRDAVINSVLRPDMMMQHHVQPSLVQHNEVKHQEAEDTPEKRDKRQILLMIKQQPLVFRKKARTTPNPFIRETNIADYDIVKTDVDKAEVDLIDTMDTNSYQLNQEASQFSNIISNFYLTTSSEHWPEIQQFGDNILKPLYKLLDMGTKNKYINHRANYHSTDILDTVVEDLVTNKRVKRKLDKTLIRKRAKKRKQKQRRVERKRLRMLTHARRLRKQKKSKLARLERHYARMNLTTTMLPDLQRDQVTYEGKSNKTVKLDDKQIAVTNKERSSEALESDSDYYSESDSENYNTESDSDDEYSDEEEGQSELEGDTGNSEYEDYEEDSSSNSYEYIDYENITDKPGKAGGKNKASNKKQIKRKETIKKQNNEKEEKP